MQKSFDNAALKKEFETGSKFKYTTRKWLMVAELTN